MLKVRSDEGNRTFKAHLPQKTVSDANKRNDCYANRVAQIASQTRVIAKHLY